MLGDLSMSEGERRYDGVVLQRNGQELADEEHTLKAEGYALKMSVRRRANVGPHQHVHFGVVGEVMQEFQGVDPKPQETAYRIRDKSKTELNTSAFLHLGHVVLGIILRTKAHRFDSSIQDIRTIG